MKFRLLTIPMVLTVLCLGCSSGTVASNGGVHQSPPSGYTGTWVTKYPTGEKQSDVAYKNGVLHGKSVSWFKNGHKRSEFHNVEGQAEGKYTFWYENGQKKEEGFYKRNPNFGDGACYHGKVTEWDDRGSIVSIIHYKNGERVGPSQP
jgi:antitoxin component YwqK of YwqJK toxin-antitoxin module